MANENSGVILLAGAGSSCHLGLPTLDDLLNQAVIGEDEVASRIRQTRQTIEAQPTRFRPAVFEELIVRIKKYLSLAYTLRTDQTFRKEAGQLPYDVDNGNLERKWKQALTRCYRILLSEYGPQKVDRASKEFSVTMDLLKKLTELNNGQIHIYTTNYDCSFHVLAANSIELTFFSHIDSNNGKFTEGWHCCGKASVNSEANKVYVHRLHGCIGWFNISTEQASGQGSFVKEVYGVGSELEIKDDDFLDQMCIKLIASQLIGTNPAFASSFDEFSSDLRRAKLLLVWGYSFRDLAVVRAINHAFFERQDYLPIIYLDPYLREVSARDTIERILLQDPSQPAKEFRPQKIPWTPNDGLTRIVPAITDTIQQLERGL